jgi:hypothetical protein
MVMDNAGTSVYELFRQATASKTVKFTDKRRSGMAATIVSAVVRSLVPCRFHPSLIVP